MPTPYIGEIRLFGFPRIPTGWLACDGSSVSISDYEPRYTLIGTTYGGNGTSNFNVPDLRGQVPISQGTGGNLTPRVLGQSAGEETHTLREAEMPAHSHALLSTTNAGTTPTPGLSVHLAAISPSGTFYAPQGNVNSYDVMASSIAQTGGNQPHDNMMPTLTVSFCIAVSGIYPSPN